MYDSDPLTQPVDPDTTVRKDKPGTESFEERLERVARNLGAYWGRAFVAAWFTVFPRSTVADIRRLWFHRTPHSKEQN